jgi:hypothetical protein
MVLVGGTSGASVTSGEVDSSSEHPKGRISATVRITDSHDALERTNRNMNHLPMFIDNNSSVDMAA